MRPALQSWPQRPPSSLELAPAEHLLICGLKAWFAARRSGGGRHREVADAFAQRTSERAGALFAAWVQAVEAAGRRPLQPDCPHCGGLSGDLQRLVVACGVARVDLDLGAAVLEPLLTDSAGVMVLARSLNAGLAAAGWPLPARIGRPDEPACPPRLLH